MSKPKTERNALILELRDEKSYSFSQIDKELKRRGFTGLKDPNSAKMQYHRLKKAKSLSLQHQVNKSPKHLVNNVQKQKLNKFTREQPIT